MEWTSKEDGLHRLAARKERCDAMRAMALVAKSLF